MACCFLIHENFSEFRSNLIKLNSPTDGYIRRMIPMRFMETKIYEGAFAEELENALDTIRPYLEADGGNVRVVDLTDDMVVKIELTGSCESCPASPMTLKAGVEQAIKTAIPTIKGVEAVNINVKL